MEKGFNPTAMDIPPSYQTPAQPRFSRKFIIISASLLVLLVAVVVAGVLLGVFIGGKNAAANRFILYRIELYQLSVNDKDGNVEQQVVQLNPKENIATFYIQDGNSSSTLLFDYNENLVVMRTNDPSECYVREIGSGDFPSLSELSDSLKNLDGQTIQDKDEPGTSSFVPGPQVFDQTMFGHSAGLLCRDVRTYWLVKGNPATRAGQFCVRIKIIKIWIFRWKTITVCVSWS